MSARLLARKIAVLVALLALLIAYYWVHKPGKNPLERDELDYAIFIVTGGALLDFLTVAAIGSLGGGIGRRALARLDLSALSTAERVALEGMLGFGVMSTGALALGLTGLFRAMVFLPVLLVLIVILRQSVLAWLADVRHVLARAAAPPTGWTKLMAAMVAILLSIAALHAFAPPTAWDAMTYHLVGPQRYLDAGRVAAYADNHFMGFPQGVEILYSLAISIFGRDTVAAPLHFWMGVLGLLGVGGLVRRYTDSTAGWMAVLLLVSSYSLWVLFGWPYVDLAIMAYAALAMVTVIRWRETRRAEWLVLSGLCGGLALGVKYTAGGLLVALAIYTIIHEPRAWLRSGLMLGGAAALAFLPWGIKGLLLYQNPVYPFLFDGLNWDASRAMIFNQSGFGFLNSSEWWQLPLLPISATVFGVEKAGRFAFTANPYILTAPFLLLIAGWRWLDGTARALARDCIVLGLPVLLWWAALGATTYIGAQVRLMMVGLPAAAVLGSLGFHSLSQWPRKPLDLYFVIRVIVVLTTILTTADVVVEMSAARVTDYFAGTISKQEYLTANLGLYIEAMREVEKLPAGSRVLFMWEPKVYYCPASVRCTPDVIFDHWSRPLLGGSTPDEVFMGWRESGVDYLLLFDYGYDYWLGEHAYLRDHNALFPAALEKWMSPIWSGRGRRYSLHTWRTES